MSKLSLKEEYKYSIVGMSGSGKSTLLNWFVNLIHDKFTNIIIIDPTFKFTQMPKDISYRGFLHSKFKNTISLRILTEEDFSRLCHIINTYDEPVFLVVDEIDRYVSPNFWIDRDIVLFFKEGRNFKKGGIFTVQRIGRLNKEILANSQYLFWFKLNSKSDLEYLNTILPENVYELDYKLKKHEFYVYDLFNSENLGKFKLNLETNRLEKTL